MRKPKRPNSGSAFFLLLAAVLLVLAGSAGCSKSSQGTESASDGEADSSAAAQAPGDGNDDTAKEQKEDEEEEEEQEKTVSVQAARAVRGDLVIPILAEGVIRARHSAEVRTEISGRVERIPVSEGQRVRKGQLLARLDQREFRVAHEEARSKYLDALSQLAVEEKPGPGGDGGTEERVAAFEKERLELEDQHRRGAISSDEFGRRMQELELQAVEGGTFRREIVEVRTGISGARAAEARSRLDLERTEIRAPFDGVVTDLLTSEGELVTANYLLCTLIDDVNVEADLGVLESDIGPIEPGHMALLMVPALQETLSLKVDVVSPRVDPDSRTCRVLLRLASQDGRVKPGMFVRAAIAGEILRDRLLVPREAVLVREGRPLVFKVADGRSQWVYVRTGERNDQLVEIESSLTGGKIEAGDRVVVSDHLTLAHDTKLKVTRTLDTVIPWTTEERTEE